MQRAHGEYLFSTDPGLLDLALVHKFLAEESYWARGIPLAVVEKSVRHSLCFGVYHRARQVGFARVATDYATFAYLMDVFVLPPHRGVGLSKRLMAMIVSHPELQGLRRWMLATEDAHSLYAQFRFAPLARPDRLMEIVDPEVYTRANR
jgi:GNAT superfamily N-acetyltransferase